MADGDRITRAEPRNHNDEEKKIEGQLAELVPESLLDITCLLEFAIDRVGQYGCMAHGAEIEMLRNIGAHSWNICGAAIDEARAEAAEKTKAKICEGFDSMMPPRLQGRCCEGSA